MTVHKDTNEGQWLLIDEASDVAASLRHIVVCLDLIPADSFAWKWAIISMHNALQGAMTCHLAGTANLGCLSTKSACAWLEWRDRDLRCEINWIETPADDFGIAGRRAASKKDQAPRQFMAKPQDLFDRLDGRQSRIEGDCGALLSITDDQRRSFLILNDLRNQFSHFTPTGWSIEVSGLRGIFDDMLSIIRAIVADPWGFRHMDQSDKDGIEQVIDKLQCDLSISSC
jgi:hypothetical protein